MTNKIKGHVYYNKPNRNYVLGGIIGSLIGLIVGIFISKVVIIDVLPTYSEDFKDFKEVVLIVSDQVACQFKPADKPGFFSKLVPKFVKDCVNKTVGKIKLELFYTFKWDPIPIHIKFLGIFIPIIIVFVCVKISSNLGKNIEKTFLDSFQK